MVLAFEMTVLDVLFTKINFTVPSPKIERTMSSKICAAIIHF